MSRTVILNKITATVKNLKEYSYGLFNPISNNEKVTIKSIEYNTKVLKESSYPVTKITFTPIQTKPTSILPFRVRFTTVGEGGEGIPGIGIAIIGYNNYIL